MKVVLIGSGNIATVFGQRLAAGGHTILQVMSRNAAHAEALASVLGCPWTDSMARLNPDGDAYILAVSDPAVYETAAVLRLGNALVVHTAGAVSLEVLKPVSERYGVLYPLQSIRKEVGFPPRIPLLIDASEEEAWEQVRSLAGAISDRVRPAGDEQRLRLHVGAVFVNNFPNYLYTLTEAYLKEQAMDFSYLQPLLQETVRRLETYSPAEVMTGPAYRGDATTIAQHEALLAGHPELLEWYRLFTDRIRAMYQKRG
jgi:predicted short-subunit dehydrogenase-like oxidoreductase (DUF2520 family)